MKDFNKIVFAKGIFYNKKTSLCIFETNQEKIKWYNVHIDNIAGEFYKNCSAKLYMYNDIILKAVILESKRKYTKFSFNVLSMLMKKKFYIN